MRWPKGVVPYKVAGSFATKDWAVVQRAIDQYTLMTCIRFVKQTKEPYYVTFWNNATGCHSHVGFYADNNYHQINLQTPGCTTYSGTPVHEMMHTLGAFHEFTRTDRDNYITINRQALLPEYQTDAFYNANFGITPAQYVSNYNTSYNYGSVMHYSRYAGAASALTPVMSPKKMWCTDFGNNNGLTDTDIQLINAMYCNNPSVMF
ncbi:astacin-like [Ochlerotatus camptorhynchus]|uniref:astacin-like n=1 Tax=Ochlerotatus camptorhynchus TaxID=644619 RepID=UPI0031E05118